MDILKVGHFDFRYCSRKVYKYVNPKYFFDINKRYFHLDKNIVIRLSDSKTYLTSINITIKMT